MRTFALTLAALVSFALNSLLCRAALGPDLIDATTFTLVRLTAGALVLRLIASTTSRTRAPQTPVSPGSVALSAVALFLYALPFSLAYRSLSAGTGAFVVFGCVQITMIGAGLRAGGRLRARELLGLVCALVGLVVLTRPGLESPDLASVALMAIAGCAWGVYSLRGRTSGPPIAATARNFTAAVPLALIASAVGLASFHVTPRGLLLAAVSGGVTSGLGYVAWYAALPGLSPAHAAIVQLAAPPLASILGIVFLRETMTGRLLFAAPLILGGIALAVLRPGATTAATSAVEGALKPR